MSRPVLGAVVALIALTAPAHAQDWPARRALTMVVPYAAGGPVDTIGRILASGYSSARLVRTREGLQ
jgi:tripartite-type tricarboxylate transporter receptor subunit TctC